MTELTATAATRRAHADRIRLIRNACRGTFSHYNDELTWWAQQQWWTRTEGKRLAWLYSDETGIIGFGVLLLRDDGYWTTTVAVLPDAAGRNYGKAIIHDLVMNAPGPCTGMALKTNPAGVKVYVPDDWDMVDGPDERYVYFKTKVGVPA